MIFLGLSYLCLEPLGPCFVTQFVSLKGAFFFKLFMSMLDALAVSRMKDGINQEDLTYRKSSIKPPEGLIYFKPIWGGGGG